MELKFEINLQRLSVIAIADSIWNNESVKRQMEIYFYSPSKKRRDQMWDSVSYDAMKLINALSIPDILYSEVVLAVDSLGKKIRGWFEYCTMRSIFRSMCKKELYQKYLKKIFWTYYGTVDEEKIIRSWFHDRDCDLWKVYIMACCFCSEDLIKEIWMEVRKSHDENDFKSLFKRYGWHLGAYWNRYFSGNDFKYFMLELKFNFWDYISYVEGESVELSMIKTAIIKGYKKAVKYFWFRLNDGEKTEILEQYFKKELIYQEVLTLTRSYRQEQFGEIYVFLLGFINDIPGYLFKNEETEDHSLLFNEAVDFLSFWPWLTILIQFVSKTQEYYHKGEYITLFEKVNYCYSGRECPFSNKDNIIRNILLELWKIVPSDYKEDISHGLVSKMYHVWDTAGLRKIFNDKDLSKKKSNLIECDFLTEYFDKNNEKKLAEYIQSLFPAEWGNDIQAKMQIIYQQVIKGEFDSADEVLRSFCRSEEEISGFKNKIEPFVICNYFIDKDQLDLADKFLYWKFISEELVSSYKYSFYFIPYTAEQIFNLWDVPVHEAEEAKSRCNRFLSWFLGSQPLFIDHYIENNVRLKHAFKKFFLDSDNFEILDHFLNWSGVNGGYAIKHECISDDLLVDKMGKYMRENKTDLAQRLMFYAFESDCLFMSDYKRERFMKKFLKSQQCRHACEVFIEATSASKMFDPDPEKIRKKMKEFIKFWFKSLWRCKLDNLEKILEWPEVSFRCLEESKQKENYDCDTTYEFDEEHCDGLGNDYQAHCDKGNLKMFMSLLTSYEDSDFSD